MHTFIDQRAAGIDAATPEALAHQLTTPYTEDEHKVRSIYAWITTHIAYNTGIIKGGRKNAPLINYADTMEHWKDAHEMTALRVLQRRAAVCDGYAKLFKTLCQYAGIPCEVVSGYARGYQGRSRFRANHSWVAVRIDGAWHLIDPTWSAGYVNHQNEFVQRTDDRYYLTPPSQFIRDHFPDDLRWSLLNDWPIVREAEESPFYCRAFYKYNITSWLPQKGLVEASLGDTLQFRLIITPKEGEKPLSNDPFFDSTIFATTPAAIFLEPDTIGREVVYQLVVGSEDVQWIHLMYNGDIVLRYRLRLRYGSSLDEKRN